ncbi:MAG: T9SS type A sorting domain-containing protein, partial [Saprospiraceae bacterium]
IDPLNSDSKIFPLSGYNDISNTKKVIYSEYIPGFTKGSYKFYILDSLQATPRLFYYSSKGLRYSKFNNSFWLFNNSGIYNLLNKDYYYSSEGLPDNSASNIVIVNISVDDEGYLYAITDMGVFVYKDRVNDPVTSVGDLETISNIVVYPNPTASYLNVMTRTRMESIEIISTDFKIIMRENVHSNLFTVNISTLSPDLYFLKCNYGFGKFQLKKFIKLE